MGDQKRLRIVFHLGVLATVAVVVLGVCWWLHGRHFVEKIATQLCLPCGLVWLGMLVLTYFSCLTQPKRVSVPMLGLFLFYWTTGASYTGVFMAQRLEGQFDRVDMKGVEPFDLLVVLGGGTRSNADGDVWLSLAGDRVILAARLYYAGKVGRLASSGRAYEWEAGQVTTVAGSAALIWQELGIPSDAMLQLDGRNTFEEMKNLRTLLTQEPMARVGLLTSAFHMPRAMRIARANDLDVIPVPADQQAYFIEPIPLCLIPSRHGFRLTELVTKEWLAALVKR
ncbi:MAG: YdcF family protein [Planctomycetaceae bacterium]|nr:YdcF family protein [Planctomycetaceae bacterium]